MENSDQRIKMSFLKYTKKPDATYFLIKVSNQDGTINFEFEERYSILLNIHENFAKEANDSRYPEFPEKRLFFNNDDNFLNQRQKTLQSYFSLILEDPKYRKMKTVSNWLEWLISKYNKTEAKPVAKTKRESDSSTILAKESKTDSELIEKCKKIEEKYATLILDLTPIATSGENETSANKAAFYIKTIGQKKVFADLNLKVTVGSDKNGELVGDDNDYGHYYKMMNNKLKEIEQIQAAKSNNLVISL